MKLTVISSWRAASRPTAQSRTRSASTDGRGMARVWVSPARKAGSEHLPPRLQSSALSLVGQGGWSPMAQWVTPEPASPAPTQQFPQAGPLRSLLLSSDARRVAAALGEQQGKEAGSLGQAHKKCVRGREGVGGRKRETENMWTSVGEQGRGRSAETRSQHLVLDH